MGESYLVVATKTGTFLEGVTVKDWVHCALSFHYFVFFC